jgi:hypothetical protein
MAAAGGTLGPRGEFRRPPSYLLLGAVIRFRRLGGEIDAAAAPKQCELPGRQGLRGTQPGGSRQPGQRWMPPCRLQVAGSRVHFDLEIRGRFIAGLGQSGGTLPCNCPASSLPLPAARPPIRGSCAPDSACLGPEAIGPHLDIPRLEPHGHACLPPLGAGWRASRPWLRRPLSSAR